MRVSFPSIAIVTVPVLLSGCTALVELKPSRPVVASYWHETLPHGGRSVDLVDWWASFNDPSLAKLLDIAELGNPTIQEAVANIDKARASIDTARAGLFPSLDGSASVTRGGNKGDDLNRARAGISKSGGLDASWELDLFGKTKNQTQAAIARAQGKVWSWHDARVSVAAELGDYYVQYRACRQLEQLYRDELASQKETIRATERSAESGFTSAADLALSRASTATSSSSLTSQHGACEILVKSMVQLTAADEVSIRTVALLPYAQQICSGCHSGNYVKYLRFNEKKCLAGEPGFEPRSTESESAVLPLNYSPIREAPGAFVWWVVI